MAVGHGVVVVLGGSELVGQWSYNRRRPVVWLPTPMAIHLESAVGRAPEEHVADVGYGDEVSEQAGRHHRPLQFTSPVIILFCSRDSIALGCSLEALRNGLLA